LWQVILSIEKSVWASDSCFLPGFWEEFSQEKVDRTALFQFYQDIQEKTAKLQLFILNWEGYTEKTTYYKLFGEQIIILLNRVCIYFLLDQVIYSY